MKEEQGKKMSQPIASPPTKASKVPVPAKPTGLLSDEDLDKVAGGLLQVKQLINISDAGARNSKDVVKLNCVNEKLN